MREKKNGLQAGSRGEYTKDIIIILLYLFDSLFFVSLWCSLYNIIADEIHRISQNNSKERLDGIKAEWKPHHYIKDGKPYPVPFHGAKEISEPLRKKCIKDTKIAELTDISPVQLGRYASEKVEPRESQKKKIIRGLQKFAKPFNFIIKDYRYMIHLNSSNKALVVIDIQNDITKNYKEIIGNINSAIGWALGEGMHIVYIKHNNITAGTRTFKPDTKGAELVPEMRVVSENIFTKTKSNALTSEAFTQFISDNNITEFYITGADATACVKSTCFNMTKAGYTVTVLSDCITSYDKSKIPDMLHYYESKACTIKQLKEVIG